MVIYIAMVTQQLKLKVEYARIHDIPVVGWWLCVVEQQLTSRICVCECEGLPCVVIQVPPFCVYAVKVTTAGICLKPLCFMVCTYVMVTLEAILCSIL